MEATILDLRRRMKDVLKALDRNESVKILYRGKERATLIPSRGKAKKRGRQRMADHPAVGMWSDRTDMTDPSAYVRKLREARRHAL